jgi:outer membrane immunogenic protein
MNKFLLSAAALALTASAALAADLPARKGPPVLPPPPPPAPMWTGFYLGLNAGGTWSGNNGQYIAVGPVADTGSSYFQTPLTYPASYLAVASVTSPSTFNSSAAGFIAGGQIGYNFQFYNSLVAGLEADIQGVASSAGSSRIATLSAPAGDNFSNFVGQTSARGDLQYIGTVRGRLGWLATPTLLLYGTGGLAYGGVSLNTTTIVYNDVFSFSNFPLVLNPASGAVNYSNTQVGWTAGGGLEWMFMPNLSAKVEYLYYDLGTVRQNFALTMTDNIGNATVFGGQVRARVNGNIARVGVNYHFNWGAPAPVVAKY